MKEEQAGIRLGAIHIIDSVPQGEYPTGQRLFAALQPLGQALQPKIETLYSRENTRVDFLDRLRAILQHVRQSRRAPIVHIEAHGLFDSNGRSIGFALASGEMVTWTDLSLC